MVTFMQSLCRDILAVCHAVLFHMFLCFGFPQVIRNTVENLILAGFLFRPCQDSHAVAWHSIGISLLVSVDLVPLPGIITDTSISWHEPATVCWHMLQRKPEQNSTGCRGALCASARELVFSALALARSDPAAKVRFVPESSLGLRQNGINVATRRHN